MNIFTYSAKKGKGGKKGEEKIEGEGFSFSCDCNIKITMKLKREDVPLKIHHRDWR